MKKVLYFRVLFAALFFAFIGLSSFKSDKIEGFHLTENEITNYEVSHNGNDASGIILKSNVPYVGKTFIGFKQLMAYKESRGISTLVNPYGYMGKYQFGRSTLRTVGIYDYQEFLNNVSLQDKAFKALLARNKWELKAEIEKYSGKIINGVEITESGLLAAAHLGGAGSVKKYLKSNGKRGFKDGFGTSLKSYIKRFGSYDVSQIKANQNAKASDY